MAENMSGYRDRNEGDATKPAGAHLRRFLLPAGIVLALLCGMTGGFVLATAMNEAGETSALGIARAYWKNLRGADRPDPGLEPAYVDIQPVVTNMRTSARGRLVQLSLTLRTKKASVAKVKELEPRIRDMVILYLRTLDESDLQGSAAMGTFKRELTARVAAVDSDRAVSDVFVGQLLLQ